MSLESIFNEVEDIKMGVDEGWYDSTADKLASAMCMGGSHCAFVAAQGILLPEIWLHQEISRERVVCWVENLRGLRETLNVVQLDEPIREAEELLTRWPEAEETTAELYG